MSDLISSQRADKLIVQNILANTNIPTSKNVDLQNALGLRLTKDILTARDFPPFTRAMMDGLIINSQDIPKLLNEKEMRIIGKTEAGGKLEIFTQKKIAKDKKGIKAIKVATGAKIPLGYDCVIPLEEYQYCEEDQSQAMFRKIIFKKEKMRAGRFVHQKASDLKQGEVLLKKSTKVNEINIAALAANASNRSNGKTYISVYEKPKVAFLASGDELLVKSRKRQNAILPSNAISAQISLQKNGFNCKTDFCTDNLVEMSAKMHKIFQNCDWLICSGGISKGERDFTAKAAESLLGKAVFHGVAQKPGKPMAFWQREGKFIFALPGNPLSCLVCLHRYVLPALELNSAHQAGANIRSKVLPFKGHAAFNKNSREQLKIAKDTDLLVPVFATKNTRGETQLHSVFYQNSGDLNAIAKSNAIAAIPRKTKKNHNLFKIY